MAFCKGQWVLCCRTGKILLLFFFMLRGVLSRRSSGQIFKSYHPYFLQLLTSLLKNLVSNQGEYLLDKLMCWLALTICWHRIHLTLLIAECYQDMESVPFLRFSSWTLQCAYGIMDLGPWVLLLCSTTMLQVWFHDVMCCAIFWPSTLFPCTFRMMLLQLWSH
jgi:hypothetical protein